MIYPYENYYATNVYLFLKHVKLSKSQTTPPEEIRSTESVSSFKNNFFSSCDLLPHLFILFFGVLVFYVSAVLK